MTTTGKEVLGVITRARFATTNPDHHALLVAEGVSATRLMPFNIMNCIQDLSAEPEHKNVAERYQVRCDFVHHNLGSSTLAISGSGAADAARSAAGGEMRHPSGETTITQYQYPEAGKVGRAVDELGSGFLKDARACILWLNRTPGGPFPSDRASRQPETGSPSRNFARHRSNRGPFAHRNSVEHLDSIGNLHLRG